MRGPGWVRAGVRSRKGRYLLVGGFNTVVGYLIGVGLLYELSPAVHVLVVGAIANVLAITVSFTTYKLFVFQTHGRWIEEYLRSYLATVAWPSLGRSFCGYWSTGRGLVFGLPRHSRSFSQS